MSPYHPMIFDDSVFLTRPHFLSRRDCSWALQGEDFKNTVIGLDLPSHTQWFSVNQFTSTGAATLLLSIKCSRRRFTLIPHTTDKVFRDGACFEPSDWFDWSDSFNQLKQTAFSSKQFKLCMFPARAHIAPPDGHLHLAGTRASRHLQLLQSHAICRPCINGAWFVGR